MCIRDSFYLTMFGRFRCVGKPGIPPVSGTGERRFKSDHADSPVLGRLSCGGARVGTSGRLLNVITQVRFLPPQLLACPRQTVPLAERLKAPVLQTGQAGSIPAGHFAVHCRDDRGSANGRLPGFEPGGGGSNPSPRASHRVCSGAVAVGSDAWL